MVFNLTHKKVWQKQFTSEESEVVSQENALSNKDESSEQVSSSREQTVAIHQDQENAVLHPQEMVVKQELPQHHLNTQGTIKQRINIYISSASTPEDEALLGDLEKQLSILKRQTDIYLWDKRHIAPGAGAEARDLDLYRPSAPHVTVVKP